METIIDTFYNHVIPGLLSGEVLCGIKVRIIANVLFKERNKLFKAKSPVQDLYIPTLVINDKERLEKAIIHYGLIMDNFAFSGKHSIEKDELPAYYIACAIANMGEKDYANPEEYFEKLCYIHENNPIQEHTENYGFVDSLNGQLSIQFRNEYPNQECPFIFKPLLSTDLGLYRFPIIRYYIVDDTVYIGAIQSTQSKVDEAINKRVRRKLYKVNANIDNQNLLSVDPAVICSLSMFLNYMSKYNINRVILLPYSLQRSNDKKLQLYYLKDIANDPESPYRARVCETIRKTSTYFERLPQIRSQLETSLLRVNYHYQKAAITIDNSQPGLLFGDLSECNNDLLSELGTAVNNKKTRL